MYIIICIHRHLDVLQYFLTALVLRDYIDYAINRLYRQLQYAIIALF